MDKIGMVDGDKLPEKCPKCGRTDCTSGDSTGLCGAGEFFDPENPPLKCQHINLSPTQPSGVWPKNGFLRRSRNSQVN